MNGKEYCYLVENVWKKGRSCQKVKKYIGPVIRPAQSVLDFCSYRKVVDLYKYAKVTKPKDIVRDVAGFELARAGFKAAGDKFELDNIEVDWETLTPTKGKRNIVIALNEGYFCKDTIKAIWSYKKTGDLETDSIELARLFVDAGIMIPKELFIAYFQKLGKPTF